MSQESPFRITLLLVLCATMSVTAYHRWQAARSREVISHKEEGYLFAACLRLAGLAVWISTLAYLVHPPWVEWAAFPLAGWLRWLGAFIGGCASLLMVWTLTSLGKNLTDTVVTRAAASLVTHGPYRWVRHPFYVTAALLMLSASLLSANALIAVAGLTALLLLAIRTPKEERMLIDRFGERYLAYAAQTGRFLPRLWP